MAHQANVLQLVHDGFEDLELWYPVLRLREAGCVVNLAGEKAKEEYRGKNGVPAVSDLAFSEVNPENIDALLVPGGWAPDKLRRVEMVLTLVRYMDEEKKPIGQICHAGWVLISAGILNGRKVTSTPGIKDDMENAGAIWMDEEVVVDGNLISSQLPQNLPAYMEAYLKVLST